MEAVALKSVLLLKNSGNELLVRDSRSAVRKSSEAEIKYKVNDGR
jgi:hypothetical protein